MPAPSTTTPLNAWFTTQGTFVGISGIRVQLAPGQSIDPGAWYTADGRRAAIAGPFRDEPMNRQGYLRGAQLLAAERLQRAAPRHTGAAPPATPEPALQLLDWTSVTIGGLGTATSFAGADLVKTNAAGLEVWHSPRTGRWYPVKNQPNGITGSRGAVLEEAARFGRAGKVCFVLGEAISIGQGLSAYMSVPKNQQEADDRRSKIAKAALDSAMGVVGLLGPLGFAIATVYFVVDTGISVGTGGQKNILTALLVDMSAASPLHLKSPAELRALPADQTRVAVPRRVPSRPPWEAALRQTPLADHNAVFRPASY